MVEVVWPEWCFWIHLKDEVEGPFDVEEAPDVLLRRLRQCPGHDGSQSQACERRVEGLLGRFAAEALQVEKEHVLSCRRRDEVSI